MFSLLKSRMNKLRKAVEKTRSALGDKLHALLSRPLDEETLDQMEQLLFEADLGSALTTQCVKHVKKCGKNYSHPVDALRDYAAEILLAPPRIEGKKLAKNPRVILVVGVNGSGKTTSCAKLAQVYKSEGLKVLLAAGDTFRAAATPQLKTWADRLGLECVQGSPGGDPSAVVFDAISAAKARGHDVVIADTAGRLQSKTDLMHELAKIKRTTEKLIPEAPHETYLVLDATTGQNALDQAKAFNKFTPLTGLVLTKLDGSAKGGIALSIYHEMGIPIRYIGIGEKSDDFLPFSPRDYAQALFS